MAASRNPIIWKPAEERVKASAMHEFMQRTGHSDYDTLYRWSVDASPEFWEALCEFCDVRFDRKATHTLLRPDNKVCVALRSKRTSQNSHNASQNSGEASTDQR